ncbi:DUF6968 family protein [Leptospira santarosai]|uniref:DUF6968 family protein n=2 Tax=Leptospira santarosai TaxID=28183 RepID=UPI001E293BA9|nr:hypothetical protein [Leptospira santarosai]
MLSKKQNSTEFIGCGLKTDCKHFSVEQVRLNIQNSFLTKAALTVENKTSVFYQITMKQKYTLGTVIAEREFLVEVLKNKYSFQIRIGKPKPHKDIEIGWYCPVQITVSDSKNIYTALGFDSMNAIQNAFAMIGELILTRLRKLDPDRLKFLEARHFGFPYFQKPEEVLREEFILISTLEKLDVQIEFSHIDS